MTYLQIASTKVKILAANMAITGAGNSGGLIALTAPSHGLESGDIVQCTNVGGTIEANGQWVVAVISSSIFTLNVLPQDGPRGFVNNPNNPRK